MFDTFLGVPMHPLVVHAAVVFVPLAALAGLLIVLWPAARAKFALAALAIATVALACVPLATESGEALEDRVGESKLVEAHSELADTLLPIVAGLWLGLAVIAAISWYAKRNLEAGRKIGVRVVGIAAMVVVVLTALGSGVQIARIGHSGAKAAWHDVMTTSKDKPASGEESGE